MQSPRMFPLCSLSFPIRRCAFLLVAVLSYVFSLRLPASPCVSLRLPASPCVSLRLPASPCVSLRLLAISCVFLVFPAFPVSPCLRCTPPIIAAPSLLSLLRCLPYRRCIFPIVAASSGGAPGHRITLDPPSLATSSLPESRCLPVPPHKSVVLNRSPRKSLRWKTPHEMLFGRVPDIRYLRVFGCRAWVHVPKDQRTKWKPNSIPMIFVGYEPGSKAYRLWDPATRSIKVSATVRFDENDLPCRPIPKPPVQPKPVPLPPSLPSTLVSVDYWNEDPPIPWSGELPDGKPLHQISPPPSPSPSPTLPSHQPTPEPSSTAVQPPSSPPISDLPPLPPSEPSSSDEKSNEETPSPETPLAPLVVATCLT